MLQRLRRLLKKLWNDQRGSLLITEWVFMASILVLGIIPGIVAVRTSMTAALLQSAQQMCSGVSGCSVCPVSDTQPTQPVSLSQGPCD
jgi:hypothetical protein